MPGLWHAFCHDDCIMDIRIDIDSDGTQTIIRIAGRLTSTAVAQLKEACDLFEDPFVIDLSNLFFADDDGINAITALADQGAQIGGASPFVQLLLDSASRWESDAVLSISS